MAAMDFTFYNRAEYFQELTEEVRKTKRGDRVAITAISIDARQPLIQALIDELVAAAERGVTVALLIDAFGYLMTRQHLPVPYSSGRLHTRNREASASHKPLQRIEQAGGRLVIINNPARGFHISHAGRSHLKLAIINDRAYVGCCNLDDYRYLDVMVGWQATSKAADWLYDKLMLMADTGSTRQAFKGTDLRFRLNPQAEVLIDAGVRGQSSILETAYQMLDDARERIFITCQYFPGGKTARHLLKAHLRGVEVDVPYSHPVVHGVEAPAHYLQQALEKLRMPDALTRNRLPKYVPKLHAKVITTEQEALVGSHNYVTQGVSLGTAEIALHVKGPAFATRLREFMEAEIINSV